MSLPGLERARKKTACKRRLLLPGLPAVLLLPPVRAGTDIPTGPAANPPFYHAPTPPKLPATRIWEAGKIKALQKVSVVVQR